jgi:hypothetical protein
MFGLASPAGGVIEVMLLALAPALAFWVVFNAARIRAWLARVGRSVREAIRPRTRPVGPPIEQIAADIRRVRVECELELAGLVITDQRAA